MWQVRIDGEWYRADAEVIAALHAVSKRTGHVVILRWVA